MLERIIEFFAKRHLLTNFIVLTVLLGGIFAWNETSKEEWPDMTMDTVRISVVYPGAPAEDVEYFVAKPIEEEVRGLDGVYRITSTSSEGQANIRVELEQNYPKVDEALTEIRNAVLDVDLPEEVIDDPRVRVFRSSKKAILDIGLIHKDVHLLDVESRRQLQQFALALENQLLALPEIHSVDKNGYLQPEIQIKTYPEKLLQYDIPFNTVMNEIESNHVRKPAGVIEANKEPKVTLLSELNSEETLSDLIIQGGFQGQLIRLGEVAEIREAFEKNKEILKVNGREAVMFSPVKNGSYGILEALEAVTRTVNTFKRSSLEGTPIELVLLDDESIDIRNRISIIGINGSIGFILILIALFIFLNKQSGIWVAMGIPFTFCSTMLFGSLMGMTINGTTLAAVIIVMGIIVDDAIVVAENITRLFQKGMEHKEAIVKGTSAVMLPIIASIVTTCVAFVPLFYFTGRFGKFIEYIPPVIFLMLGASLIESILILPGHMDLPVPFLGKLKAMRSDNSGSARNHWFEKVEKRYGEILEKALPFKNRILAVFCGLLALSALIATTQMKFVMFPNEETRDIVLAGTTEPGSTRYETAELSKQIEDIVSVHLGKEVVGFRTQIARSRRGGAVEENRFRMIIEIVPKEKRKRSADQIIKEFEDKVSKIEGFTELKFQKSRWGQDSGSPIELIVQQNNDALRKEIVSSLVEKMKDHKAIKSVEVDQGLQLPEYRVSINREKTKRLSISPDDIASTLRAALEGRVLYEFSNGDEDVRVRFSIVDAAKDDINKVLDLPVENTGNYLVPLREIVSVEQVISPNAISRRDLKRTTIIDADLKKKSGKTPLEVAEYFEENVFPSILSKYPTTTLTFGGEVQDTRESKSDFRNAILLALVLIYGILVVLFNSLLKPLIIMLAIPFGIVGIVLAFWLHGKTLFGFYSAVGALGLAGVVINDSIIMLDKLDKEFNQALGKNALYGQVAAISQTRLRAVFLTTLTTVAGVLPTAYGFAGYDAMLAEMMLSLTWGLIFGTCITLVLIPCVYTHLVEFRYRRKPEPIS